MKKISLLLTGMVVSEILMISIFLLTNPSVKGILALLSTKRQRVNKKTTCQQKDNVSTQVYLLLNIKIP